MNERVPIAINRNPKNCEGCIFLTENPKIDRFFCGKTRFNIEIIQLCHTGPLRSLKKFSN